MADQFFPYDRDDSWKPLFMLLRLSDDDGVTVTDDGILRATYGKAKIETPLENIDHTELTRDHRWYTAVGIRLSFSDDGITFGTNNQAGLCIGFVEKIPKVMGFKDHSALWVSVAEPDKLAEAIGR
jgi:hypothetical protein